MQCVALVLLYFCLSCRGTPDVVIVPSVSHMPPSPVDDVVSSTVSSSQGTSYNGLVCSCLCCLQGSCVPVINTTWTVTECAMCSQMECEQRVDLLEASWTTITTGRKPGRPACLVLHSTEQRLCSGMSSEQCRRYTSIRPQCANRSSIFQTVCCVGWTAIVGALVAKGLWKRVRKSAATQAHQEVTADDAQSESSPLRERN